MYYACGQNVSMLEEGRQSPLPFSSLHVQLPSFKLILKLLHREHGTGARRSWHCCDRRTRFVVMWKHFCFILSTSTRIRIDSVMRPRSSSGGRNTSASVTVTVTVNTKKHKTECLCVFTCISCDCRPNNTNAARKEVTAARTTLITV